MKRGLQVDHSSVDPESGLMKAMMMAASFNSFSDMSDERLHQFADDYYRAVKESPLGNPSSTYYSNMEAADAELRRRAERRNIRLSPDRT